MAYSSRNYLTVKQLADYLGYEGTPRGKQNAARAWVERTGIPKKWRGKTWLVHPDDADRALAGDCVKG